MAAPEEQDLTQEQTEKLLQFQVAASSRCSKGRRGMGSGALEERKTILRLGLGPFSDRQAAPSPPDANCPDFPGPQPLSVPSPPAIAASQAGPQWVSCLSFPLRRRFAVLASLTNPPDPLRPSTVDVLDRDTKSPSQSWCQLAALDRRPPSRAIHRHLLRVPGF